MQTRNIVSNNLKEFVLQLEAAVKEGYAIVEESVDFHAGYWKTMVRKEERVVASGAVFEMPYGQAVEMLDNPEEPNEALKELLNEEQDKLTESQTTVVEQQRPKTRRNRK
jgi:uncharacterized protein (DUF1778 family)